MIRLRKTPNDPSDAQDSLQDGDHRAHNYEEVADMLQAGTRECDESINGLIDRAKSTLGVGAIVLSVIIAGTRAFASLGENGPGDFITKMSEIGVTVPVPTFWIFGTALIIASMCVSLVAFNVVKLRIPFGSPLLITNNKIDPQKFDVWNKVSKDYIHKRKCESYATTLQNRERILAILGKLTFIAQTMLIFGLVISSVVILIILGI